MEEITRARMRAMLWNWGHALDTIAGCEGELRILHRAVLDAEDTLGAQRLDGLPRAGGVSDPVARAAQAAERRMAEYERAAARLNALVHERMALKCVLDAAVAGLDGLDGRIIELRYRRGLSWAGVAARVSYSEAQARMRETRAIDRLRRQGEVIALTRR